MGNLKNHSHKPIQDTYMGDKVKPLDKAISEHLSSGDSLTFSGGQYNLPSAAAREIVRQGIDDLTFWGPTMETAVGGPDMMAGCGLISEMNTSWIGNFTVGSGYGTRYAIQDGMEINTFSNYTGTMALTAAYFGLPFIPIKSLVGTDTAKYNDYFDWVTTSDGEEIPVIEAADVDVAIMAVPRADKHGNAQAWSTRGFHGMYGAGAADRIIVVAEEIVSDDITRSDPDRTVVPRTKVEAVAEVPWSAHPSGLRPLYAKDVPFQEEIGNRSSDREGFQEVVDEWVHGTEDNADYLDKYVEEYGRETLEELRIDNHEYSASVDYGYKDYADLLGGGQE
jgi:glutaconate CoA-transferase subunit A